MSDITLLSQMDYGDAAALRDFMLTHATLHSQYASAIVAQSGVETPNYGLIATDAQDSWIAQMNDGAPAREALLTWLQVHSDLHTAEFQALALGTIPDIQTVDFRSQDAFYQWLDTHQQMHDITSYALGVQ